MNIHNQPIISSRYTVLGEVQDAPGVWLVRNNDDRELYLLQKILNPTRGLLDLLQTRDPQLPGWLDGWRHGQALYLVFQRTPGHGLDELCRHSIGKKLKSEMTSLVTKLCGAGFTSFSENAICLDQEGRLRLRWFPCPRDYAQTNLVNQWAVVSKSSFFNSILDLLRLPYRRRAAV